MTARIVAVSGGLGLPSSSRMLLDRITGAVERCLDAHGVRVELTVIELRDLATQIAGNLVTGYAPPELAEALERLHAADGIVAVSPVFNASVSGLFKSFFDLVQPDAIEGIPVALAATGGTERHSLVIEHAMRPLFAYLRALPMPTGLFVATSDWGASEVEGIDGRATRLARELADAVRLLRVGTADAAAAPGRDAVARDVAAGEPAVAPLETPAEAEEFAALMSRFAGQRPG